MPSVVITGIGALSCLGQGAEAHAMACAQGRSGLGRVPQGRVTGALGLAGWVSDAPQPSQARSAGRGHDWLAQTVGEACAMAGIEGRADVPLLIGSTHGHIDLWQHARRSGDPMAAALLWDMAPSLALMPLPNPRVTCFSTACTASSVAAGQALALLRSGAADVAVVAGFEVITDFLLAGFEGLRALSRARCRPFDAARDGLTLGEGAAALVLETEDSAKRRGVLPPARVTGYGYGSDAAHLTAPDPRGSGAARALTAALSNAALSNGSADRAPDMINLHGTGTPMNDRMEIAALRRALGDHAAGPALTATKPLTGHMCGAAGAMEMVLCVLALRDGVVPPVAGLTEVDAAALGLDFVRDTARPLPVRRVVSMNSGFGGTNTALVLEGAA
jgi:3-oxoacyl-[acyl-carrier-protein] synthase II